MKVFVKICGLTDEPAVEAAVEAGTDAVGFVFAESPRRVTPERAAELSRDVPDNIKKVAVMLHPSEDEWCEVCDVFRPDWLQTDAGDIPGLDIGESVRAIPVFRDTPALDEAALLASGLAVFEAAVSGEGRHTDWERAAGFADRTALILAGGLHAGNVAFAIERVRPFGVDVSSGVERSRGIKDPASIESFIRTVRETEHRHAG